MSSLIYGRLESVDVLVKTGTKKKVSQRPAGAGRQELAGPYDGRPSLKR
jgi:hypothetical protein